MFAVAFGSAVSFAADWSSQDICRAGLAALLIDDPRAITVTSVRGAVVYLDFTRRSDGSIWRFKCLLDGDRILWGSVFTGSEGRWRTEDGDGQVRFEIRGREVIIRQDHPDGSQSVDHYRRSQL